MEMQNQTEIKLVDYFAGLAMQNAVQEMQETVPASFWDLIKLILVNLCHMHWLEVHYKSIPGVKERVAKMAYEQAILMVKERSNIEHLISHS